MPKYRPVSLPAMALSTIYRPFPAFVPLYRPLHTLEAQFGEAVGYGEDVVIGAGNPDGAVLLQLVAAKAYPSLVEVIDFLGRAASVPFALVDADDFASLHRYSIVGEEVGRVGKYHVEMEIELREQFKGIAMKEGEVTGRRAVVRGNHRPSIISWKLFHDKALPAFVG